ncbi:hypothetical protein B0J14DRAFT_494789, partial [Halenospora varia]
VICVHGLNPKGTVSHATHTWTHKDGNFWPRTMFPKLFPTARVLLFAYNSAVIYNADNAEVGDHSVDLIRQLEGHRDAVETSASPIVFICHSLGSLVTKKALVTAKLNDAYQQIIKSTRGLVFFGTLHRGGNGASIFKHGARALSVLSGQPTSTLVPILEKKSTFSESLAKNFQRISGDYRILTFFEKRKTAVKIGPFRLVTSISQISIK